MALAAARIRGHERAHARLRLPRLADRGSVERSEPAGARCHDGEVTGGGTEEYLVIQPPNVGLSGGRRVHRFQQGHEQRATILDDDGAWFGFEQEYFFYKDGRPLGFPEAGYPAPQGPYYTGVGYKNVGSVAREIVDTHGGTIGVRSQFGEGATFVVTLPRHSAAARAPQPSLSLS